jgi:mevalonate kinase
MEMLINSDSMVTAVESYHRKDPEDGDDTFSEMVIELELHGTKAQKASIIDTAVKVSQKTVFFDH